MIGFNQMSLDFGKLKEIIDARNFSLLVGEVENAYFDCKGEPYAIDKETGKMELAKDVSAFANTTGGFILIGIKTEKSDLHWGDEIKELRPFKQDLVDTTQYENVISSWVFPTLENATVEWVKTEEGKGIVVITIPEQSNNAKPFLNYNAIDGKKRKETFFGFTQRRSDTNQPAIITDLQKALRSGFHYENQLSTQLESIELLLKQFLDQNKVRTTSGAVNKKITELRAESLIEHSDMKNKRLFVISAYSNTRGELKSIFLTSDGSIRKHLENPPTLRRGGWSIETLDRAHINRGEMIQVTNGDKKILGLYLDGTLIFAGLADYSFLAWGGDKGNKINSLGLIEVIYNFVNFYRLVLDDFEERPEKITLRVDFLNMHLNNEKGYLVPDHIGSYAQLFDLEKNEAPDNNGYIEETFVTSNLNIGAVAYSLVRKIYLWFGIEDDKIPYVKDEDGVKIIDAEAIKKI